LRKVFGNGKFDEYSILTKPGLPVDFLYDRKRTTRSAIHLGFTGLPIKELGCNVTRGVRIRRCRPAIPRSCRSLFRHDVARLRRPAGGFVFVE
jgi:hypothetical protein